MLVGINCLFRRAIALVHHWQQAVFIIVLVVEPFLIHREETGKFDHLAGGAQFVQPRRIAQRDRGPLKAGRLHLAGHRALVDQAVKLRLVTRSGLCLHEIGRADRFVCFLGILGLGTVMARLFRKIMPVIAFTDRLAAGGNGAAIHLHAVSPHISDQPGFIQLLRTAHGVAGVKAQFARGFLLQGRGGEWR